MVRRIEKDSEDLKNNSFLTIFLILGYVTDIFLNSKR